MSDELIVSCCAPTLAGIKTGNLFSCRFDSREEIMEEIRRCNLCLRDCGMIMIPLRFSADSALIYLYRPDALVRDLSCPDAEEILSRAGYRGLPCNKAVARLKKRLSDKQDFPHEIGLFLSYPPEDVRGFIDNRASNSKVTGYWKVYGDEEKARITFEKYKKCTENYCSRLKSGYTLKQLAVAV